jgi:hypothetical protein
MCAACPTPRLNLNIELLPSWNNNHDTSLTGTAQDTTPVPQAYDVTSDINSYDEGSKSHPWAIRMTVHYFCTGCRLSTVWSLPLRETFDQYSSMDV